MNRFTTRRFLVAAVVAGGLAAMPALAQDTRSGTIDFSGGSVAFIAGVHWGGGTLHYNGQNVPLKVSGLGVGEIGANKYSATGEVYNLHNVKDIEGVYGAVQANATLGGGAGVIDMKNDKGVEIRAHSSSAGLKLALAPSGMHIELK